MVTLDAATALGLAGASSGGLSLFVNAVNARRAFLASLRPKVNVELTSDLVGDKIECHLEVQNVGVHEMRVRSFRLYIYDAGFKGDLILGLANYSTNLYIHDNTILNKANKIAEEFTYENFVLVIQRLLGYSSEKVEGVISREIFGHIKNYSDGLDDFAEIHHPYSPVLFIRPFFLFLENVKMYSDLKKMPEDTFPQAVDVILFDAEAYESSARKDVFALSDSVYRLDWESNPAWSIQNAPELRAYETKHAIHDVSPIFATREDKAILSVSPTELGFPETFAPQEKRSMNFEVSALNATEFKVKVNLWITSIRTKFLVLNEEITNNYHFSATPRSWIQPIRL